MFGSGLCYQFVEQGDSEVSWKRRSPRDSHLVDGNAGDHLSERGELATEDLGCAPADDSRVSSQRIQRLSAAEAFDEHPAVFTRRLRHGKRTQSNTVVHGCVHVKRESTIHGLSRGRNRKPIRKRRRSFPKPNLRWTTDAFESIR